MSPWCVRMVKKCCDRLTNEQILNVFLRDCFRSKTGVDEARMLEVHKSFKFKCFTILNSNVSKFKHSTILNLILDLNAFKSDNLKLIPWGCWG